MERATDPNAPAAAVSAENVPDTNLYRSILLAIGDGIIATDAAGRITLANDVALGLTGWTRADAIGRPFDEVFHIIDERTHERCASPVQHVLATRRPSNPSLKFDERPVNPSLFSGKRNLRTILIARDGSECPIGDSATPIIDDRGDLQGAVMVFRDATEEIQRLDRIEYLSFHDALTGLYNRHFFEEELRRCNTARNLPLTIVSGDVNGLKLTNDAFGHQVGDTLLQQAAAILTNNCRQDDIIARVGGDEFVILLPRTSSEQTALLVQRLNDACSDIRVGTLPLSISFGWETKTAADEDINEVRRKSENWMYRRKLFDSPSIRSKTIDAITQTLFETHLSEERHSRRVSQLCASIGRTLNMGDREIQDLKTTGLLHDIGKIAIDNHIINKPGPLTDEEWIEVRRHSEIGYRILGSTDNFSDIATHLLAHHERWDGQGYPKGLKADQIPLIARIICLADAFEAMTSERPYRPAHPRAYAIREILANAGTQFDPDLARLFVHQTLKTDLEFETAPQRRHP